MIDVVYLAYANEKLDYGIEVVEKFLDSYKKHAAGIEHNFVIIAKNWTDKNLYVKLCSLAKENNAKIINLPDDGLDFGAYFRVSKILDSELIFFLGSNIEILKPDWLLYPYNAFKNDNLVRLVGPMGSWEKGVAGTASFPNYHIRTCCFMIDRKLFLEYASTQNFPKTKEDTWQMEHGSNSLTKFVLKKGYKAVVVNSDGKFFAPENWVFSQTYMSPDESKTLMADKWAKRYYIVKEENKIALETIVWGKNLTKYPKNLIKDFSKSVNIFIPYKNIIPVFTTNVFHPIFLCEHTLKFKTEAFKDNNDINVAFKKNYYGELTGYYWIWKNYLPGADTKYIGFCQNQRFLDFNISKINNSPFRPIFTTDFQKVFNEYTEENISNYIYDYDVILPEKVCLNTSIDQYLQTSSKMNLDSTLDIIKELYPQYIDSVNEFISSDSLYPIGSFIMKKELLNEFMEWLFSILEAIEQKLDLTKYLENKDNIESVFSTENFLNIWLMYNIRNKNLKIKTTTSFLIYYDIEEYMAKCLEEIQMAVTKG